MVDFYLLSVIIFAIILAVIFFLDRKNVKRESILLLRRTKRGKESLIRLGTRFPRFWKVVGIIGVAAGFIISGYTFLWLIGNSVNIMTSGAAEASFMFVLPSASPEANMGPGYLAVPFWYWIISIGLLIVVHEGFHGIMAAMEKVRIKSLGWGLLAVIPLAFVEPDEEELQKKSASSQLRVFAAGSFANFLLAGVCLLIGATVFSGMVVPTGVAYQGVFADYPAEEVNLTGMIIRIDDYDIRTTDDLSIALREIGHNKTVTIYTLTEDGEESFTLKTAAQPEVGYAPDAWTDVVLNMEQYVPGTTEFAGWVSGSQSNDWASTKYEISFWEYTKENYHGLAEKADQKIAELNVKLQGFQQSGFIGISQVSTVAEVADEYKAYSGAIGFFSGLLFFIILINLGVGVANLLPIKPLDGGRMWDIVFKKYFPDARARSLTKALSLFTFLILIINFVFPMII